MKFAQPFGVNRNEPIKLVFFLTKFRAISNYINVEDDLGDLVGFNNGAIASNSFYNQI